MLGCGRAVSHFARAKDMPSLRPEVLGKRGPRGAARCARRVIRMMLPHIILIVSQHPGRLGTSPRKEAAARWHAVGHLRICRFKGQARRRQPVEVRRQVRRGVAPVVEDHVEHIPAAGWRHLDSAQGFRASVGRGRRRLSGQQWGLGRS